MTEKNEKSPIIGNIVDAFDILDLLSQQETLGISSIATALNLPKTRVFRIVKSLEHVHAIKQADDTRYSLDMHMLKYARGAHNSGNIIDVAEPFIKEAVEKTGESINLGMAHNDDLVIIRRVHGEYYQLQTQLRPIGELYCSGMGKIFLAYRDEISLRSYYENLPSRTVHTINTYDKFLKEQQSILENNISVDHEEFEYGLSCYAVPIFNKEGIPEYALSISGPSTRLEYKNVNHLLKILKKCAEKIQSAYYI